MMVPATRVMSPQKGPFFKLMAIGDPAYFYLPVAGVPNLWGMEVPRTEESGCD